MWGVVLFDAEIFTEVLAEDADTVVEVTPLLVSDVEPLPTVDVGCRSSSSCTGELLGVVSGESLRSEALATSILGEIWPLEMLTDGEVVRICVLLVEVSTPKADFGTCTGQKLQTFRPSSQNRSSTKRLKPAAKRFEKQRLAALVS